MLCNIAREYTAGSNNGNGSYSNATLIWHINCNQCILLINVECKNYNNDWRERSSNIWTTLRYYRRQWRNNRAALYVWKCMCLG
jgi:hypothetical protein